MTKFGNATSLSTRWNTETILVSLERGMFVDEHPRSSFSPQRWAELPQNDKQTVKSVVRFSGAIEYTESNEIWRVSVDIVDVV